MREIGAFEAKNNSSITLAWYFSDERTPAVDAVLTKVAEDGAVVPSLWHLELPLATLDPELRAAGGALGVTLLGS